MRSKFCKHCGVMLYDAPTTYTTQHVNRSPLRNAGESTFTAPLRRNFWHNGTAEEVTSASRERGVNPHHVPEP